MTRSQLPPSPQLEVDHQIRSAVAGGGDPPPAVELRDVRRRFVDRKGRAVDALDGVSMTVAPREFAAIIGPSGCGKSTMLRMIAALDEPTGGSVLVHGEPPLTSVAARRVGMAFQEHALLPWLTVRENVVLPFRIAGQAEDAARVSELIRLVGLEDFEHARPRQLSGGMKQRVAIARTLALRPDVLMLDEPFGALDAITRRRLNSEFGRIWADEQVTTLLVTHSVEEAVYLADTVYVMTSRPGRLLLRREVDLPRPRTHEMLTDPAFHRLVDELTQSLDEGYGDG